MHPKSNVFGFFASNGFVFSDEVITRYVLSLATKPFVILSGISGTGKTKIAQLFADYMCQKETPELTKAEREERIAFVPVRPDWLDNRGILGYYNILDQSYYSTDILSLLLRAKENPGKPYFIIMDEMNLAKVEYYFSDFLSIMESRTPDYPEGNKLHLHNGKAGAVKDAFGIDIPKAIHIPANVYFTGTVNVDESTYMFSPKVLDRANVIEFNDVDLLGAGIVKSQFRLLDPEIINSFHAADHRAFCHSEDFQSCEKKTEIDGIHKLLGKHNLHFGYRVANEFARFVNLSIELGEEYDNLKRDAIDIQLLQKILPKFHGTKGKLRKPLSALKDFCEDRDYKHSTIKLAAMLEQLELDGYTSFIQ